MNHQAIDADFKTITWAGNAVADWTRAGQCYGPDGERRELGYYSISFGFDRAITSDDGQYVFVYQVRGTKGVLLKNGETLREINRSYYRADIYEYPAAFATVDGVTYLVHCPVSYCQLDFEHVETGELVTNIPAREPNDMFQSRLEVSPAGGYFASKGWFWHPWDGVRVFDIRACLQNPLLLDGPGLTPETSSEISTACFVSEQEILLGASGEEAADDEDVLPPGHMVVWNFQTNTFRKSLAGFAVNVFPLDEKRVWDMYGHPKIVSLETGEILDQLETVDSGQQASSIIQLDIVPAIAFNRQTRQIAVRNGGKIDVLSAG